VICIKGVVKIVEDKYGNIRITNLEDKGTALEYAVKMKEFPQKFRMDNLVSADKVSLKTIDRLTEILVNNNKSRFYLYDRIEFNDSLRYTDVAEDVAHLSMDLDYYKRNDLRKHFSSKYVDQTNDYSLQNLLYFLMCYKACVRAMVSLFQAKNERIYEKRKIEVEESKDLLELARSYRELF
jgi:aminoglycoside phosphotransferase family enzyme